LPARKQKQFLSVLVKSSACPGHVVADGIKEGRRDELVGGGLKRSQGKRPLNVESFDARVLGNGDFVDSLKQEEQLRDRMKSAVSLTRLIAGKPGKPGQIYLSLMNVRQWNPRSRKKMRNHQKKIDLSRFLRGFCGF